MEYKCNFCGKTFTDPDKYTQCVMTCRELESVRKAEEERKKIIDATKTRRKRIDDLCGQLRESSVFKELSTLCKEEYGETANFNYGSLLDILPHALFRIRF